MIETFYFFLGFFYICGYDFSTFEVHVVHFLEDFANGLYYLNMFHMCLHHFFLHLNKLSIISVLVLSALVHSVYYALHLQSLSLLCVHSIFSRLFIAVKPWNFAFVYINTRCTATLRLLNLTT